MSEPFEGHHHPSDETCTWFECRIEREHRAALAQTEARGFAMGVEAAARFIQNEGERKFGGWNPAQPAAIRALTPDPSLVVVKREDLKTIQEACRMNLASYSEKHERPLLAAFKAIDAMLGEVNP